MKKKNWAVLLLAIFASLLTLPAIGAGFDLAGKKEGVIISSLPASSSPSVPASRANAMAGLAGKGVSVNRSGDPAAWWVIPKGGLKPFDPVTTTFGSWMGTSPGSFSGERGHRLVTHVCGKYPVSKYWVKVSSSTPLVTGGFFQVGMTSPGNSEIAFNQNFVGIAFGANGKLDSQVGLESGLWEQKGDDVIYANGELPSAVTYDVWYRFGSTTVANISNQAEFAAFNEDFDITSSLIVRNGAVDTVVATQTVYMAPPPAARLSITKATGGVVLKVIDGSPSDSYNLESAGGVKNFLWVTTHSNVHPGDQFTEGAGSGNRFYRLKKTASAGLAVAGPVRPHVALEVTNGQDDN